MSKRSKLTGRTDQRLGHERVMDAIKYSLAEGHYEGRMLPSYRQLVRELNVTKASVERAMAELEREGLIRRERGRGVFPQTQPSSAVPGKPPSLQCINIVAYSFAHMPSFVWADYLEGYTEALDYLPVPVRMRFVAGNEPDSRNKRLLSPILPMAAQGVLFVNSCPSEIIEWLRRNSVPFMVQYYARYVAKGLPPHFGVYVNKAGGTSQAVNHLLELGHRNIGFIGSVKPDTPLEEVVFEGYRSGAGCAFDGYRAALTCAGLECVEDNVTNCDCATREKVEIFAIAKAFLDRPKRPTAVVTSCDEYALALLDVAHAMNLRVPEDLSIVGCDNQPESERADPPLTTVSVPRRELARSAVKLLLDAAATPRVQPDRRILETQLIIRKTTAPPRAIYANNSTDGHLYCS